MSELSNKKDWFKFAIEQKFIKSFEYSSFNDFKEIGTGGFGTVHSAYSKHIDKVVALKSLHNHVDIIDGFINEIKNITEVDYNAYVVRFFGITQ
ncbi:5462_t:CDS:2, partial [Scutellospora calospora]